MTEQIFDIESLKLDDIKMVNAAINNETGLTTLHKDEEIVLDCSIESGVNLQVNKIRTIFHCNLKVKDNLQITGSFVLAYIFSIDELSKLVELDEGGSITDMHHQLLETLANTTYSTSRGIIYSRCLGTIFNKIILPVSSTKKILNTIK